MAYEVTATRRRPQQFEDLVGQEFVAETLKNSIKTGKIAHAYLFTGPRGCGKTSTARILAKALNCQNGPTECPCGVCSNCQEILKGSSLDVIEIDGASNTSVENARQIKDEVLFPPTKCRYKIYIIDEVHMLSNSAFNALLKTIEEPPPYVIFIFATTELQKVPATIKSRCQQFNFRLVSIDKVKECLSDACKEMNIQADDEALFWIARESTGSMRDAYTLFDQVVAFSDGYITYDKIKEKLGIVGLDRLNNIFELCASQNTQQVITLLDEFLQSGISVDQIINNTADYLRSLLLIKSGVNKESLLGNSVERYSNKVLNVWNIVQIERALSIFLQLYKDVRYSLSPRYELELAFSRLCWIGQYVSNMEVKKAIDAAQQVLMGGTANLQPPEPVAPSIPSPQPVPLETSNIPQGLPKLVVPEDHTENFESAGENTENPFLNGGPLPPEKSMENTQDLHESLPVLQVNTTETTNNVSNANFVPESPIGYSENPDDENDGWTNVDEPLDEGWAVDSDAQILQEEDAFQEQQQNEHKNTATEQELQQTITCGDGRVISLAQLRGTVLADFSVSDGFTAATLENTKDWQVLTDKVIATVENAYEKSILEKKSREISEVISKICSRPMNFEIILNQKVIDNKTEQEIPEQVRILVDVFKGSVVNK